MNQRRVAVRTLAVVGALSGLGLLTGCGAGTDHTSSPSAALVDLPAKQILAEARAAAKAAGSLHYASTARSGSAHVVYGVDSSANSGRQVIKILVVGAQLFSWCAESATSAATPPPWRSSSGFRTQ